MSLGGISPGRLLLYGSILAVLIGLNLWRGVPVLQEPSGPSGVATAEIPELPDIRFRPLLAEAAGPEGRDLFVEASAPPEPEPGPEPELLTPPPPPPDPRAARIAQAERTLSNISIVGILSASDGMVAVIENGGTVETLMVGDVLIPGFRVREISVQGVLVRDEDLNYQKRLNIGAQPGN